MILKITFDQILYIWKNKLWPNRVSIIESNSAMKMLGGYDMCNMSTVATFFGYQINDVMLGVNSGHYCPSDNSYRSRGLYVFPEFRNKGIGKELLLATIDQGKKENANFIWSYPKKSSWHVYQSVGFDLVSGWEQSELDINAYCKLSI